MYHKAGVGSRINNIFKPLSDSPLIIEKRSYFNLIDAVEMRSLNSIVLEIGKEYLL
jgi:hypothetical protein